MDACEAGFASCDTARVTCVLMVVSAPACAVSLPRRHLLVHPHLNPRLMLLATAGSRGWACIEGVGSQVRGGPEAVLTGLAGLGRTWRSPGCCLVSGQSMRQRCLLLQPAT